IEGMKDDADNLRAEPRHYVRLLVCLLIGGGLWFAPVPAGLAPSAWHIFAVFAATIVSFLLRPLPMGVCVLLGLVVLATTGQMSVSEVAASEAITLNDRIKDSWEAALVGYADSTVWLVVAAFMISTAMVHSGLGRRIGLIMVSWLGRTTLGLGY